MITQKTSEVPEFFFKKDMKWILCELYKFQQHKIVKLILSYWKRENQLNIRRVKDTISSFNKVWKSQKDSQWSQFPTGSSYAEVVARIWIIMG